MNIEEQFNAIIFDIYNSDEHSSEPIDRILNNLKYRENIERLNNIKGAIEKLGSKEWDSLKKRTNPFESITTSYGIANYSPISRAYFKMTEIIHHFKSQIMDCIGSKDDKVITLHLAEGPGGFIECFNEFFSNEKYFNNKIYGITLIKDEKNIPGWRKSKIFLDINKNVSILTGKNGTGNLYDIENIYDVKQKLDARASIVTADGGFDYSNDFNEQENLSFPLIYSQSLTALLCLKKGGIFILKIFDMYNIKTLCLLNILKANFEHLKVIKPYTSRPANSEKYLICVNYLENISSNEIHDLLLDIPRIGLNNGNHNLNIYKYVSNNIGFYKSIKDINDLFFNRQIKFIQNTLELTDIFKFEDKKDKLLENQIYVSIEWCKRYNFKINYVSKLISIYLKDLVIE